MAKITMEQVEKINAKMGNGFKLDIETFLSYKEKVAVKEVEISEHEYLEATLLFVERASLKIELHIALYKKAVGETLYSSSGTGVQIIFDEDYKRKNFVEIQKKTHKITDEFIIQEAKKHYGKLIDSCSFGRSLEEKEELAKKAIVDKLEAAAAESIVESTTEPATTTTEVTTSTTDTSINTNTTQNTKIDDEIKKLNNKAFCGFKLHEDHYKKHGVKEFAKKIIVGEYALVFTIFLFTINEYKTRVCMDVSLFINELCNEPWSFLANKNYVVLEDGLKKASVRSLHKWTKILTDEYLLNLFNKENAFSYIREMMSIENNANETQLFSKNDELNNNNYEDITDQSTEISDDNEALESLYCGNLFDNYNHKETQSENLANDIFALEPCTKETNQSNPESKKDIIVMTKMAKAKQDVNKSAIMIRAWAIYHTLENGDRRTKLSIAMRQAWSEYKSGNFAMSESTGKKAA